ncbi:exonuclease [Arthrobacter phage Laroye]|uniref:Exonuclease n=1 Tax=Arthrobacter phage Laroye TaxID=1772305 RepID=A0A0U4JZI7_9CAUD|nr:exonuclease [Arthrobacter phage Laroye]ALY09618.1 exonuclease [Arthrobacter phage Laroye]
MSPQTYKDELLGIIEADWERDPRTLQRRIGPSGIGHPCNYCLGAQLAEVPKDETGNKWADGWPAFLGKAVHWAVEKVFERWNRRHFTMRFLTEQRVNVGRVGTINGFDLTGSSDLYDITRKAVVDWKVTTDKNLAKVKKDGKSQVYKVQGHVYGLGMENLGFEVEQIGVMYLPKMKNFIREAEFVIEPYDRQIALDALKRASDIWDLGQQYGWGYILPRLKHADDCWDCTKYAAGVQKLMDEYDAALRANAAGHTDENPEAVGAPTA